MLLATLNIQEFTVPEKKKTQALTLSVVFFLELIEAQF